MSTRTFSMLKRTAIVVAAIAAFASVANATPVFSSSGDPFPAGSTVTLTPGFDTPFGHVDYITLLDFAITSQVQSGANQNFKYTATFFNEFKNPSGDVVGSYTGTTPLFEANILARPGFFQAGTFAAQLLSATFNGNVTDLGGSVVGTLQTRLDPGQNTTGTVTYVGPLQIGGIFGMTADSLFSVPAQYAVNGGTDFTNVPLTGASTPAPAAVPGPATLLLIVPGLLGFLATRRRALTVA